ncbi:transmembrane signal receptor [Lithospermum erythrorhizon]|uniref:Transmembrane signal receptor n=1 Tax=Lithospermum erythrorhizon TaxID=34254 RepID=A0AAV3NS39_LITER
MHTRSYQYGGSVRNGMGNRSFQNSKPGYRKREMVDRSQIKCEYSGNSGHVKAGCFKLVGFPDWWPKSTNGGFDRGMSSTVNNVVYPNEYNSDYNTPLGNVMEGECSEEGQNPGTAMVNFVEFAGITTNHGVNSILLCILGAWIIDSGASTHVCSSIDLFEIIRPLKPSLSIRLPDDTNKYVHSIGTVKLSESVKLFDCLYVSSFKYNILSDSRSNKVLVVRRQERGFSVLNYKLSTPILSWKSPYKALFLQPPNLEHLKVFGCLCFVTYTEPHKSKFQERAHPTIFISYPPNQKAFSLVRNQHSRPCVPVDHYAKYDQDVVLVQDIVTDAFYITQESTENAPVEPESGPSSSSEHVVVRHSHRSRKPSVWLNNYVVSSYFSSSNIPSFTDAHMLFIANLSVIQEPTKTVTERLVLALAAANKWHLHQLDVNNSFLHGYLDEEASRQWNHEFTFKLIAYGFVQSSSDSCMFVMNTDECFMVLVVYVDDILLAENSKEHIKAVKLYLDREFTIKDLDLAKYFLGIEIARSDASIFISQRNNSSLLDDPAFYRRLIGRLLYFNCIRPDHTYVIHHHNEFMQHPKVNHWNAAIHVVKYLNGTTNHGLFYVSDASLQLQGFCDADWVRCKVTRRSITAYCILLGTSLISRKSKKQNTDSKSSAEAELRLKPIPLRCDNQAAVHIVENPVFHERTKHIEIDCHLVRDHYKAGFIQPAHVPSKQQLAGVFTKALPATTLFPLLVKMGFLQIAPS